MTTQQSGQLKDALKGHFMMNIHNKALNQLVLNMVVKFVDASSFSNSLDEYEPIIETTCLKVKNLNNYKL